MIMATTEQILPTMRRAVPQIYMYDDTSFPGWIKIGQTTRADVRKRIDEQHPITEPHKTYHLLWHDNAFYADGSGESFSDHDLHEVLRRMGKELIGEWCRCSLREAKAAYVAVRHRDILVATVRDLDYTMRDEQKQAVNQTAEYFEQMDEEEPDRPSHYLWNAKMRFGKTFATYQLAKKMGAKRILVLTFKPAVEDSWRDDLLRHRDFEGWRYYSSRMDERFPSLSSPKPLVVFGSFQDYLGRDKYGNIKPKNEWVHSIDWDLIVLDEYHFGAWNDNAKSLLDLGDADAKRRQAEEDEVMREGGIDVENGRAWDDEDIREFMENQIFNWTYQDEQAAKIENSKLKIENGGKSSYNPYEEMPTMVMMTYQMPQDLGAMIEQWDMDGFDLNEFFRAEVVRDRKGANGGKSEGVATFGGKSEGVATFVHEKAVQKWLDIIRGKTPIYGDSSSPLNEHPPLPFEDTRLLDLCAHTMWFLPNVASCDAMEALLRRPLPDLSNHQLQRYEGRYRRGSSRPCA